MQYEDNQEKHWVKIRMLAIGSLNVFSTQRLEVTCH